jgi:hypothetical protein
VVVAVALRAVAAVAVAVDAMLASSSRRLLQRLQLQPLLLLLHLEQLLLLPLLL